MLKSDLHHENLLFAIEKLWWQRRKAYLMDRTGTTEGEVLDHRIGRFEGKLMFWGVASHLMQMVKIKRQFISFGLNRIEWWRNIPFCLLAGFKWNQTKWWRNARFYINKLTGSFNQLHWHNLCDRLAHHNTGSHFPPRRQLSPVRTLDLHCNCYRVWKWCRCYEEVPETLDKRKGICCCCTTRS